MRVLVVEDERPLAAGLRNGLVAEGSRSTWRWTAPTGCGPRAPLCRDRPGIMLPGVNGYRLCSILRREESGPRSSC
jgi:two-component system, OmpR family, response regulator